MPKPNDDIQELKRRLSLLERFDGRVLVCAEGPVVTDSIEITDAGAIVAACRAGRPSLSDLRAGLAVGPTPLLVTPAVLAAAQRDLRVLEGPRVAAIVRSAGRIFRRRGDLDAAWIAAKQARIDALSEAARAAAATDAGGGALPPWFERVVEVIRAARGDESAGFTRSLAEERISDIHSRGAAVKKAPRKSPRGAGPREDLERALIFLAHAALWFDPRPRHEGDRLQPTGNVGPSGPSGAPGEDHGVDVAALRAMASRFKGRALRLDEAIALSRLKLGTHEARLADLVEKGLPVDRVERMKQLDRARDLATLRSGVEVASAYAEWVITLKPHYEKLGLDLPITPELFDRMAASGKSDLGVLAVCLLKHHSKAEPDTAPEALARLDATLALFSKRPDDVASILGELTGTTAGAGRQAMPEIAAWLGDDALLDRYVHLCRIAGQPTSLSRTLRADFDRRETLSRERDHLASLPSRSPVQQARLDRLLGGDVAIPAPERTRRRLAERIPELLAQAYEARLDAVLRRIARDAWGIQVPRLTPGWRDAIRFYLAVEDNRELLATVLRTASSGADLARALPKNQAWIASVSSRFDVAAWLAPRARDVDIGGERHRLEIERDPIEVLRMGIPFDTCLSLEDGGNAASTVVNAADANKHVVYLRDARGRIVARKLLAVSRDDALIGYHLYIAKTERKPEIAAAFRDFCQRLSHDTGLSLAAQGKPKQIHPGFWYDDGPVPFEGSNVAEAAAIDVTAYCRSLGLDVPARVDEDLREEALYHDLLRRERVEELTAALRAGGIPMIAREAHAWLAGRLDRERRIEAARHDWHLAEAALKLAAKDGYRALLSLAGRIAGSEGAAGLQRLLRAFPPTGDLGLAFLEAAVEASRSGRKLGHGGIEHLTFDVLPEIVQAVPVAGGFTLCDRAAPLWRWYARKRPGCDQCATYAEYQTTRALVKSYRAAPDPAAVLARLSGKGSPLSRRAAVEIAAECSLEIPGGGPSRERLFFRVRPSQDALRALARLRRRDPERDADPEMLAAVLRQGGGVPRGVDLPVPKTPPFETLADLLAQLDIGAPSPPRLPLSAPAGASASDKRPRRGGRAPAADPDIAPALARWTGGDIDLSDWEPGPWELYYHRRTGAPRRARAVEQAIAAALAPATELDAAAQGSIHRLAQLGDTATLGRLVAAQRGTSAAVRRKRSILERASALAREIEGQMASAASEDPLAAEAERRSRGRPRTRTDEHDRGLYLAALARIDRHLAEGAGETTRTDGSLELAFELVIESDRFLGHAQQVIEALVSCRKGCFSPADIDLIHAWLKAGEDASRTNVPVSLAFHLLSVPSIRPRILPKLAGTGYHDLRELYEQLEALAAASGQTRVLDGLFEDLVTVMFDKGTIDVSGLRTDTQLRAAARLLVSRGVAAHVITAYKELTDHRAISIFLEELEKSPLFTSPELHAEIRRWREGEKGPLPVLLEWLLARVDSPSPGSRRSGPKSGVSAGSPPPDGTRKRRTSARPLRSGGQSK